MGNWFDLYKSLEKQYGYEPQHKLIEYLSFIKKGKVLDLGTGTGRNSLFLAQIGYDVEAIDVSKSNIDTYVSKVNKLGLDAKARVADIRDIDIPEGEYSLIIVSWVLNFFNKNEIDLIIEKIKKGLKPDGIVYFSVFSTLDDYYVKNLDKACDEKNTLYFAEYDCYRYYYDDAKEVIDCFEGLEALSVNTGMMLDIDEQIGNHYHHTIEYLGKKI